VSLFRDESGKVYVPREVIEQLSALSAVPIYGAFDSYVGYGITGGSIESFTERGERLADLIAAALDRPTAAAVTADLLPSRCIVDARIEALQPADALRKVVRSALSNLPSLPSTGARASVRR
jgi:hypothetical protein